MKIQKLLPFLALVFLPLVAFATSTVSWIVPTGADYTSPASTTLGIQSNGRYYKLGPTAPNNTGCSGSGSPCLELWGNDNTASGVEAGVGNTSTGTSAYSAFFFNNDLASSNDTTHFGSISYSSSNFNDTTFGLLTSLKNQLAIQNTDGPVTVVVASTSANALFNVGFTSGINGNSSELLRVTPTGVYVGGATSPSNKFAVNGKSFLSGNVGIGTSNALTSLDLGAGTGVKELIFGNGGTAQYLNGFGALLGQGSNSLDIFTGQDSDFAIDQATKFEVYPYASGYTTRFIVKKGGNVGIGTSTPSASLQITGSTSVPFLISSSTNASMFSISQTGATLFNNLPGTTGQVLQSQGSTASPQWVATSSLGISGGGSVAGSDMQIQYNAGGAFGANSNFIFSSSSPRLAIGSSSVSSTLSITGSAGVTPFTIASSTNAELFRVQQNGFVGIGTTTPSSTLTVGGSLKSSSAEITSSLLAATTLPNSTSSFLTFPSTAARNDFTGDVGFTFLVNKITKVYRLGRLYVAGNTQNHVIKLWDSSNTVTPLASATILAASPSDANGFKWVTITPVTLNVGSIYAIAIDETNGGDTWKDDWTPTLKDTFPFRDDQFQYRGAYGTSQGIYPNNVGTNGNMFDTAAMDTAPLSTAPFQIFENGDVNIGTTTDNNYALNVIGSGDRRTALFDSPLPFATQVVINTNVGTDGNGDNAPFVIKQVGSVTTYIRQDGAFFSKFFSTLDNASAAMTNSTGVSTANVIGFELNSSSGMGWSGGANYWNAWDTYLGRSSAGVLQIQTPGGGAGAGGLLVGQLGIGTSTPTASLQATNVSANATTTVEFGKAGQTKGTCMVLYRTDGSQIYASVAAGATTFTLSTVKCN